MQNYIYSRQSEDKGEQIYSLITDLYPICRSITGDGVRQTLAILRDKIPLQTHEVPTGQEVFDWRVPKEWNIRDAFIKNSKGERVVDFNKHNLHVVNYSIPVHEKMNLQELKKRLHTLPDNPDWIPYRTSYYHEDWGFCLTQRQLDALPEDDYEVVIDSSLENGSLTYGEYCISGVSEQEIIIYTHVCHPSLCNDNLSGIAVATYLAQYLSQFKLKHTYRFVFAPGTIGSITWLKQNEQNLHKIKHGLIVALVGDDGPITFKRNRNKNSAINRIVENVLTSHTPDHQILEFSPYGYDERQFCSPGINLDFARITRTPNSCYAQYHTSADDLDFVKPFSLYDSYQFCLKVINVIENDALLVNTNPKCEPQLGKRGLYSKSGGQKNIKETEFAMLWLLNQADGKNTLLDIAERSKIDFCTLQSAADALMKAQLLKTIDV